MDEPSQAALGSNYGGHRKSAAFLKQLESLRPTLKTQGQASGSLLIPIRLPLTSLPLTSPLPALTYLPFYLKDTSLANFPFHQRGF